jgi:hypothetical protein
MRPAPDGWAVWLLRETGRRVSIFLRHSETGRYARGQGCTIEEAMDDAISKAGA